MSKLSDNWSSNLFKGDQISGYVSEIIFFFQLPYQYYDPFFAALEHPNLTFFKKTHGLLKGSIQEIRL